MPFGNPILNGATLARTAIQSEGFVTGATGWQIARDGSAEFNNLTVRGEFFVNGADGSQIAIDKIDNNGSLQPEIALTPGDPAAYGNYSPAEIWAHEQFPGDPGRVLVLELSAPGWAFPSAKTSIIRLKSDNLTHSVEQVIEMYGRVQIKDMSGSNGALSVQGGLAVGNPSNRQHSAIEVTSAGVIGFTDGNNAADVSLARSAVGVLQVAGSVTNAADGMTYLRGQRYTITVSNASVASFTQAFNFPTAFPPGVIPNVIVNVNSSTGAVGRAIVQATSISNTGFTLWARTGDGTVMGAWSGVQVQVTVLV